MVNFQNFDQTVIQQQGMDELRSKGMEQLKYGIDTTSGNGKFKLPDGRTFTIEIAHITAENKSQLNQADWQKIALKVVLIMNDKGLLQAQRMSIKPEEISFGEITFRHADTSNGLLNTSQRASELFALISSKFQTIPPITLPLNENQINNPIQNQPTSVNHSEENPFQDLTIVVERKGTTPTLNTPDLMVKIVQDDTPYSQEITPTKNEDLQLYAETKEMKALQIFLQELQRYPNNKLLVLVNSKGKPQQYEIDPTKLDFTYINKFINDLKKQGNFDVCFCGITKNPSGKSYQNTPLVQINYQKEKDSVTTREHPLLLPINENHTVTQIEKSLTLPNSLKVIATTTEQTSLPILIENTVEAEQDITSWTFTGLAYYYGGVAIDYAISTIFGDQPFIEG